jgi:hypothetical protein
MVKEKLEKFIEENFKGVDFKLEEIKEDQNNYFGYLKSSENYDVPILVYEKATNKIKAEFLPPFTDDSKAKTIFKLKGFKSFDKKDKIEETIIKEN